MNILLINHYAGALHLGMEYRPLYMAKSIVELGHKMYVLGADQSHLRHTQPKYGDESIQGIDYLWLKSRPYSGNGLGRVLNIFSFLLEACKRAEAILNWSKPDVIVASSTYPLDNYLAHYLAKKCGAKVVYEVHDLWPLSPIEIGPISKWHPFMLLLQLSENFAYKHADQVISMLPNTLQHMTEHGLDPAKFSYIPNGVSLTDSENKTSLPKQHIDLLDKLKLSDRLLIGYAGGHAKSNALHKLIGVAKCLPQFNFVLVGGGSEKAALRLSAENISNVYFLDAIHKSSVAEFLNRCDILTIVWNDSPLYRFGVSANKLFDYMLAAKPIVQALTSANDPVSLAGAGITVASTNSSDMVAAFLKLGAMTEQERAELGQKGYKYVLQRHSYSKLAKKFIKVCKKT